MYYIAYIFKLLKLLKLFKILIKIIYKPIGLTNKVNISMESKYFEII